MEHKSPLFANALTNGWPPFDYGLCYFPLTCWSALVNHLAEALASVLVLRESLTRDGKVLVQESLINEKGLELNVYVTVASVL